MARKAKRPSKCYKTFEFRAPIFVDAPDRPERSRIANLIRIIEKQTGVFWRILHVAKRHLDEIEFRVLARDTKGNLKKNNKDESYEVGVDARYIANALRGLMGKHEEINHFKVSSQATQGTYHKAAETLRSWFKKNEEFESGKTRTKPRFPTPDRMILSRRWAPLVMLGPATRIVKNRKGDPFVALPVVGARKEHRHPDYEQRTLHHFIPLDGEKVVLGGQTLVPLDVSTPQRRERFEDLCALLQRQDCSVASASASLQLVRREARARRNPKAGGNYLRELVIRITVGWAAPRPYEPKTCAGIALGPKTIAYVTILNEKGDIVAEKQWDTKLLGMIAKRHSQATAKGGSKKLQYADSIRHEVNMTALEVIRLLQKHEAVVAIHPVENVKKHSPAPAVRRMLKHWSYRKLINQLRNKCLELGVPVIDAAQYWQAYSFICSSCGSSNKGIEEETEYLTDIEKGTNLFLCSVPECRNRTPAPRNTSINLAKEALCAK